MCLLAAWIAVETSMEMIDVIRMRSADSRVCAGPGCDGVVLNCPRSRPTLLHQRNDNRTAVGADQACEAAGPGLAK
jgi:hypothetical protein